MMREPWFWRSRSPAARAATLLLTPAAIAYQAGHRLLWAATAVERAPVPVICVGNATLGGAGKTPFAMLAAELLREEGVTAHFVTRGYGGALTGPVAVDPDRHNADDVGDEALLLARRAPAVVSRNRLAGARLAAANGAQAIVMDDGFQNPSLRKDLSILVIDAAAPYGNAHVFPAGPLREPVKDALARADAVVLMAPRADYAPDLHRLGLKDFAGPVLTAWLAPAAAPPSGPLVAFAGIGRPQKFFDTLRAAGGEVVEEGMFPDHHPYRESHLKWLERIAAARGARLITTEKDFVRLPQSLRDRVTAFPVEARFADEGALDGLLRGAMDGARALG
jgi:tetraacyldisaccharide 4'-kinase